MKEVTYQGNADTRSISSEEWQQAGVTSKEVEWDGRGDTQELSNAAADWLLAHSPHEFKVEGETPDEEALRAVEQEVAAGTGGDEGVRTSAGASPGGGATRAARGGTTGTTHT